MEKEEKKVIEHVENKPTEVMENPEATIKRLVNELTDMRSYLEKLSQDNQILRATIKALTQLL
jgi:hypothetical protein